MGIEPLPLDAALVAALAQVTTATLTTVLLKKGLRNTWLRGARPLAPAQARRVGRAFTLRFVPAREDLATPASWGAPISTRAAIEAMPDGAIAVVDAMGVTDAGIFGDILCARMARRGVGGLVTDGVIRDLCRRARDGAAGLVPGRGGARVGRGTDLRRLAGAGRLRRRRGVPQRRRGRRRRRRRGDSGGAARCRRAAGAGAGTARGVDHGRGRAPARRCRGSIPPDDAATARYRAWAAARAALPPV